MAAARGIGVGSGRDAAPSAGNFRHYAEIVREQAKRRRLIHICGDLAVQAYDPTTPAAELLEHAAQYPEDGDVQVLQELAEASARSMDCPLWFITVLLLLVLLPMAMTMALLWKTKEVILDGVFGSK